MNIYYIKIEFKHILLYIKLNMLNNSFAKKKNTQKKKKKKNIQKLWNSFNIEDLYKGKK